MARKTIATLEARIKELEDLNDSKDKTITHLDLERAADSRFFEGKIELHTEAIEQWKNTVRLRDEDIERRKQRQLTMAHKFSFLLRKSESLSKRLIEVQLFAAEYYGKDETGNMSLTADFPHPLC